MTLFSRVLHFRGRKTTPQRLDIFNLMGGDGHHPQGRPV